MNAARHSALFFAVLPVGLAHAYEFRIRFVERIGEFDRVLANNELDGGGWDPRRVRIQFGVFDDPKGPAPEGGFLGWNVGAITVHSGDSDESRTPGRLAPFNFAPSQAGSNGVPQSDPFEAITRIDNTLGSQVIQWNFGEPMPMPAIRGRNTFVSTYEITVDPHQTGSTYFIDFSGNLLGAQSWVSFPDPLPPESADVPGAVYYAPFSTPPVTFSTRLRVEVPAPTAVAPVMLAILFWNRRRGAVCCSAATASPPGGHGGRFEPL